MPPPSRFPVTVDVLVFVPSEHGPALLCIERAHQPFAGCWALPGGFVDEGEDLVEAALRELLEEIGLNSYRTMIQLAALARLGVTREGGRYGRLYRLTQR